MPITLKAYYGIDPSGNGFFWPVSNQKKVEYFQLKRVSPYEAESIYGCNPSNFTGSLFKESFFSFYEAPLFLDMGISNPTIAAFLNSRNGVVIQSWDTAQEAHVKADWSVCTTAFIQECSSYHNDESVDLYGECDPHYDVYILDVFRGKFEFGDLFKEIKRMYKLWMPHQVLVEKKASGIGIIQGLKTASQIPVTAMEANESKRTRAITNLGAGSVQGWFQSHRVHFPEKGSYEWVDTSLKELKNFTGIDASPGVDDFVDSIVHLVTYAITRASESVRMPTDWEKQKYRGDEVVLNQREIIPAGLFAPSIDMFAGTCARCSYYGNDRKCSIYKVTFPELNSCEFFTDKAEADVIR